MPLQFRNASATSGTMQNKLNRENHFQCNIIGIAATTNFLPIGMCLISELVFAGTKRSWILAHNGTRHLQKSNEN
jgi:hypothetical protein